VRLPKSLLVVALFVITNMPTQACTCVATSSPKIENWRDRVDVVFQGTITSRSMWLWGDAIFRVSRVWKGSVGSQFRIEGRVEHSDCDGFWGDHLKVGTELIVFAKRGSDGIYRTSVCYPTAPVSAVADVAKLGQGNPPGSQ
jgi:hypothetical protein